MTWIGWTVLAVVAVALVLTIQLARYVRRVDRLDAEVQRTRAAMDSQLAVRATRALDLAHSAAVDPATAMLLSDVASRALESSEEDRTGLRRDVMVCALCRQVPPNGFLIETGIMRRIGFRSRRP